MGMDSADAPLDATTHIQQQKPAEDKQADSLIEPRTWLPERC